MRRSPNRFVQREQSLSLQLPHTVSTDLPCCRRQRHRRFADDDASHVKLKSTGPVKMTVGCSGIPVTTGVDTMQLQKGSDATDTAIPIDATPTDDATTSNASASTIWQSRVDASTCQRRVYRTASGSSA